MSAQPDPRVWADAFAAAHLARREAPARLSTLVQACTLLDCQVETAPLGGESGRTFRDGNRWKIQIAEGQNYRRQRFTLAHELGHLLLRTQDRNCPDEERFCDEFAAELLMPRQALLHAARSQPQTIATARDLADRFHVTTGAAVVRLNQIAGWSTCILTFWSENGTWLLYSTLCTPKRQRFRIRSGQRCRQLLEELKPGPAHLNVPFPLKIDNIEITVAASVWRDRRYALAMIDRRELVSNGAAPRPKSGSATTLRDREHRQAAAISKQGARVTDSDLLRPMTPNHEITEPENVGPSCSAVDGQDLVGG